RLLANMIGATFKANEKPDKISSAKWGRILEFVDSQRAVAQSLRVTWPEPKGRWGGKSGTKQQMQASVDVLDAIGRQVR
ncbi:MAG: hypothetical protein ABL889_22790, partial [Terricaulis sp.]